MRLERPQARQTPNQNKFSAENSQSASGGYFQSCDCIVPLQVIGKALSRTESDLQVVAAGVGVHVQHLAAKYVPAPFLLCMVLGSTSRTDTPPLVMTAWARSPRASMDTCQCLTSRTSSRFCSRVIWFALVAGVNAPARTMTGCILEGSSLTSAPCAAWFASRAKSRVMRSYSCSSLRAGFRSISAMYLCFFHIPPDGWTRSGSAAR